MSYPPPLTEDGLQTRILGAAKLYGWQIVHIRPARAQNGWRVPYEGDPGLPDLIMARNGIVLLAELKSATGKATADQKKWLAAAGPNGRLWRPADWDDIVKELM